MTAANHTSLYRFSFPDEPTDGSPLSPLIFVDLSDLSDSRLNGTVSVDKETGQISGNSTFVPSFGSGTYTLAFCADFQGADIRNTGIYVNNRATTDVKDLPVITQGINGFPLPGGGFTQFSAPSTANNSIVVRVGLSFISIDQACQNAKDEVPDFDFDGTLKAAEDLWRDKLSPISIVPGGVNDTLQTIFWSGVYRTMQNPQDYSNENPLWDSDEPYFDSYYW